MKIAFIETGVYLHPVRLQTEDMISWLFLRHEIEGELSSKGLKLVLLDKDEIIANFDRIKNKGHAENKFNELFSEIFNEHRFQQNYRARCIIR